MLSSRRRLRILCHEMIYLKYLENGLGYRHQILQVNRTPRPLCPDQKLGQPEVPIARY